MQRSDGAGDAVDSARPGFHLTCTFRGHGNEVHGVVSNARVRQFASLDEKSIKVWKPSGNNGGVELLVDVPFPGFQGNYVTCLVYVDKLKVYIASCLEGSLHVYTDAMNMMVELELPKEARGVVTDMVYDDQTDELITAGDDAENRPLAVPVPVPVPCPRTL